MAFSVERIDCKSPEPIVVDDQIDTDSFCARVLPDVERPERLTPQVGLGVSRRHELPPSPTNGVNKVRFLGYQAE